MASQLQHRSRHHIGGQAEADGWWLRRSVQTLVLLVGPNNLSTFSAETTSCETKTASACRTTESVGPSTTKTSSVCETVLGCNVRDSEGTKTNSCKLSTVTNFVVSCSTASTTSSCTNVTSSVVASCDSLWTYYLGRRGLVIQVCHRVNQQTPGDHYAHFVYTHYLGQIRLFVTDVAFPKQLHAHHRDQIIHSLGIGSILLQTILFQTTDHIVSAANYDIETQQHVDHALLHDEHQAQGEH
ncbi:uncharacterized protein PG986_009751 [Apiospora aurea]|uniref:Uncharacterized protein n=1 Tax=Apiospora aurea TaxID=335848 RepID=A0ABR1Q8T5_9PEZI